MGKNNRRPCNYGMIVVGKYMDYKTYEQKEVYWTGRTWSVDIADVKLCLSPEVLEKAVAKAKEDLVKRGETGYVTLKYSVATVNDVSTLRSFEEAKLMLEQRKYVGGKM